MSKYIIDLGYSDSQAGRVIAIYGLIVALASWMSGVLAEVFSPRRLMTLAFIIWIIFMLDFNFRFSSTKLSNDDNYVWYSWIHTRGYIEK